MSNTVNQKKVRIYVQNLAGDSIPFDITENDTVENLKRRISAENVVECEAPYQRLVMKHEEEKSNSASAASSSHAPTHTVLDDDSRTLILYGVMAGTTLHVICNMRYLKPVNEFAFKSVSKMAISPDNQEIYIPYGDKVKILNTLDGSEDEIDFKNDDNPIEDSKSICFSPDGEYFFILGESSSIRHRSLIQKRYRSDKSHVLTIRGEDISPDTDWNIICTNGESLFASDTEHNIINVFDAFSGNPLYTIGSPGGGIGQIDTPRDMAITRNDELFVLEWGNTRVQVFRATTGEPLRNFILPEYILYVMDVSPDGNYMYINDRYSIGTINVIDASDGSLLETTTFDAPSRQHIRDICVSLDGSFVFVSTRVKIIQYATPGHKMGGRRYKKQGILRKYRKSRARRVKKRGTKRKQRK